MTPAVVWAVVAGVVVMVNEAVMVSSGRWDPLVFVPLAVACNYVLYRLVSSTTSLVDAFVVFALVTQALRVAIVLALLRQPVSRGAWAGLALVALANAVRHYWR